MITKMKKYTFLVFHKEYDAFLTLLREAGVVHISEKAEGVAEDPEMQRLIVREKEIQHILSQGAPDQLLQERQDVQKRLDETRKAAADAAIWGDFDTKKIAALREAGYTLSCWTCPKAKFQEEWGTPVAEKGGKLCFAALNAPDELADCERITLTKSAADLRKDVEALNGLLVAADARIAAWQAGPKTELEDERRAVEEKINWQKVVLSTDKAAADALCLLEGYCPEDKTDALNAQLNEAHIFYEMVDPVLGDNAPTQLKNNRFNRLFECFTGMYGWPTYGEFDPTPVLAPFYLLFFSLCMGDAGYGILLILFGLLTYYRKINIAMFEGLGPIITTLGVGTTIVGFFLGTAFGVDLSTLFPSIDWLFLNGKVVIDGGFHYLTKAQYAASGLEGGYDAAMVLALGIGVFHICLAMVIKAVCYTQRFGFRENLSTWGWTLLLVGGLCAFILCMVMGLSEQLTKIILIVTAAISALGIYVFNKPGRNPLLNIGAGLWDTYNMATGVLGDVLSYIRLYALGLAGGMLGGAFNNLGLMVRGDDPTWQWVPFILILIVGHLLNLAMSALGAFVHPLRLTFVEYFKNSGYEGKGELYKPFAKQA